MELFPKIVNVETAISKKIFGRVLNTSLTSKASLPVQVFIIVIKNRKIVWKVVRIEYYLWQKLNS